MAIGNPSAFKLKLIGYIDKITIAIKKQKSLQHEKLQYETNRPERDQTDNEIHKNYRFSSDATQDYKLHELKVITQFFQQQHDNYCI